MALLLKRTSGQADDFDVIEENSNKRLGRVYFDGLREEPWRWVVAGTIAYPPPTGRAATCASAVSALVQQLALLRGGGADLPNDGRRASAHSPAAPTGHLRADRKPLRRGMALLLIERHCDRMASVLFRMVGCADVSLGIIRGR